MSPILAAATAVLLHQLSPAVALSGEAVGQSPAIEIPAGESPRGVEARLEDYKACGVNSLFVVLRMKGCDISYDELYRTINPDPNGYCSMADLERAVRHAGFFPLSVKLSEEEWSKIDQPGIAQVVRPEAPADSPHGREAHKIDTHFLIFVKSTFDKNHGNDEWVYFIDPPMGTTTEKKAYFLRYASGFFLAICRDEEEARQLEDRLGENSTNTGFALSSLIFTCFVLLLCYQFRRKLIGRY